MPCFRNTRYPAEEMSINTRVTIAVVSVIHQSPGGKYKHNSTEDVFWSQRTMLGHSKFSHNLQAWKSYLQQKLMFKNFTSSTDSLNENKYAVVMHVYIKCSDFLKTVLHEAYILET